MSDTPLSMVLLYTFGDLVFALLTAVVLVIPIAVPAVVWFLRR